MTASLDLTDAITLRDRIVRWNGGHVMAHSEIMYQMGGRPKIDPYGWRPDRIQNAIDTAVSANLIEPYEWLTGTRYRALT